MKISRTIWQLERSARKYRKDTAIFVVGLVVGQIVTVHTFGKVAGLLDAISKPALQILVLLLLLLLVATIPYIVILINKVRIQKRYLKEYAPELNIDTDEEINRGHEDYKKKLAKEEVS